MAASSSTLAPIHQDVIQTHILTKLDGQSLSTAACVSSHLNGLCTEEKLWSDLCKSTWPSISNPLVGDVISTFPDGHRSFFKDSFTTLLRDDRRRTSKPNHHRAPPTTELISAVDIHYQDKLVCSKIEVTETVSKCFLTPPLWIELHDQKETDPIYGPGFARVNMEAAGDEIAFLSHLEESMTLSWILIDPDRKRAGNFSSVRPVSVRRHWLTEEIELRYVTILAGGEASGPVQCKIEVTCRVKEGGELHVRELILQVQDMERRCLSGKDTLVILQVAMEGGRRKMGKRGEERERYVEFLELRREKKMRDQRWEMRSAMASRSIQVAILVALLLWISGLLVS